MPLSGDKEVEQAMSRVRIVCASRHPPRLLAGLEAWRPRDSAMWNLSFPVASGRGRWKAWKLGGLEAWRPGEIRRWLFCKSRCWELTSLCNPRTAQALRIWWYFYRNLVKIIEKSVFEGIWGTPNHNNVTKTRQGIKNQRRRSPKIAPRRLKVVPNLTQARPTAGKLEAPQLFQEPNPLKIVETSARIDAKTLKTWNLWNQQNQWKNVGFSLIFDDF